MQNERTRHLMLVADPGSDQVEQHQRPVRMAEFRHPELAPVLTRAMASVVRALKLGERTPPSLIFELEHAAAAAMIEAYEPFAVAASRLGRATELSRATEAASVRKRAQDSAALVEETTVALRQRHDLLVERAAQEAVSAVRAAAASSVPGFKFDAKRKALHQADSVRAVAAARTDERTAAAALTAAAAREAEVRLAIEAEHAAFLVQHDARQAADAIRATALSVMYEIAVDAACRHFVGA